MPRSTEQLMALVDSAREGGRDAQGSLIRELMPELRAYVRLHAGQRIRAAESSSDLVQTVCRELVEDLGDFRGDSAGQFRKWLFTIAMRKIQMRGRALAAQKRGGDARQVGGDDDGALLATYTTFGTPSRHAAAREQLELLEAAFDQLPGDYRDVLTQVCVLGMSHREVAEETGRNEAAVRKLLSRARSKLALVIATGPDVEN